MDSSKIVDFEAPDSRAVAANRSGKTATMRSDLVEEASKIIPEPPVLINMVSRRVKQLNLGRSPLVPVNPGMGMADVALQEIIEGKVVRDEEEEKDSE